MKVGISIIIVTYNIQDSIQNCVGSYLNNLDYSKDEIIIIDNNSDDETVNIIEKDFPNLELIKNSNNAGYSKACNQGYKVAKNDLIIFSNGDIIVPVDFLELVRKKMADLTHCGILGPKLTTIKGDIIQLCWAPHNLTFIGEFINSFFSPNRIVRYNFIKRAVIVKQLFERSVPIVVGACMIVRREVLEKLRGMDENFELYFEDSDICYRCRKAGWQVIFSPEIIAYHELGQSSKSILHIVDLIYRQSQI